MNIVLTEVQGPRGAQGTAGPVGPKGSDALVPTNISAFVNDAGYITANSPNTLTSKIWQGSPIADAYIAGAATWNAKQSALGFTPENITKRGAANGYCPLDASSLVPSVNLPAYVDDVVEYSTKTSFPSTGTTGVIYVALDTNKVWRWSGSTYIEISGSPGTTDAVPEGVTNLYYTTARMQSGLVGYPINVFNNNAGYLTLGTLPTYPVVPTVISAFTNDSGYYNVNNAPQIAINSGIGVNVGGGGTLASTGQLGYIRIPYNATIYAWSVLSDVATTAQFDVWKRQSVLPDVAYSICGSQKPSLTGATTGYSNILSAWTNTAIQANDIVGWNLDTNTLGTRLILQLFLKP